MNHNAVKFLETFTIPTVASTVPGTERQSG